MVNENTPNDTPLIKPVRKGNPAHQIELNRGGYCLGV